MALGTVVNAQRTPFIVDDLGHVLGGGERAQLDPTVERVAAGLKSGHLLAVDTPAAVKPLPAQVEVAV